MHFASPQAFGLLLLLPLAGLWRWRRRRPQGLPISSLSLFEGLKQHRPWRLYLSRALYLAFFLLLVLALARPQSGHEVIKTTQKGIDIMLAVDTSASMQAQDFKPNRLEAARNVIQNFVGQQQGNRLGIVVFAGASFTLMPLSTDYAMIMDSIAEIHPQIVREPGTAIGDAIANALYRFGDKNKGSRVIILLTDGENTAGHTQPLVAAQMARQKDVRIHVIGMGKPEGVPVPIVDPSTGRRFYLRDNKGNLYLSRINEDDLKQIASLTGGLYFRADNNNSLHAIYAQINQMEKSEFETHKRTIYTERMHWFLIPALLCLLGTILLRQGRGQVLQAEA